MRKRVIRDMRTAKAQTSLRIRSYIHEGIRNPLIRIQYFSIFTHMAQFNNTDA